MRAVNRATEHISECLTAEVGGRYNALISHHFHAGKESLQVSFKIYPVAACTHVYLLLLPPPHAMPTLRSIFLRRSTLPNLSVQRTV
jgi:hypothetical protein